VNGLPGVTTGAGQAVRRPWPPAAAPGDGGPATQAELVSPTKVIVARSGFLYVADARSVRLISP